MTKELSRKYYLFVISLTVIIADQVTKHLLLNSIKEGIDYDFIPYLIQLKLVRNYGAAFSLFNNHSEFLGIISFIVSIFLILLIYQKTTVSIPENLWIPFLLAGSIGNGIDRWQYGYVVDFIKLTPVNFPIFNIADISINIAVILLARNYLKSR